MNCPKEQARDPVKILEHVEVAEGEEAEEQKADDDMSFGPLSFSSPQPGSLSQADLPAAPAKEKKPGSRWTVVEKESDLYTAYMDFVWDMQETYLPYLYQKRHHKYVMTRASKGTSHEPTSSF